MWCFIMPEIRHMAFYIITSRMGEDLYNPYLSPCFGSFADFPKTIFVCGSADLGQSDSFTAYEKLKSEGVETYLFDYENMFHDFQMLKFLPESRNVFKRIKKII